MPTGLVPSTAMSGGERTVAVQLIDVESLSLCFEVVFPISKGLS